ncbi:FAD-binding protein [Fretibacterium fastidiosum]|nr:FAD-binding protein [Fretibacterium fastidiosum]
MVGAGPAGVFVTAELARHGKKVRIADKGLRRGTVQAAASGMLLRL